MFEKYKQQHNDIFMKNPLIQKLKKENRWTVSDKNKRPVDAKHLLETHQVRNARVNDTPYPLVTLEALNNDPNLLHTNRAYRTQAQLNNVIVIDVEPEATDDMLEFAINFPAHLTEISRNGGVHLFIEIPKSMVTPENEYLLKSTVIKSPNNDYEIISNDHYITFTKRIVLDKPIADFEQNIEHRNQLERFLNNIVEMDAETQRQRKLRRRVAIDFDDSNIHHETIEKLLDSNVFIDFMAQQAEKSPSEFNNDLSRYEASIGTACAGHVNRFVENLPYTQVLKDTFEHMTENDWIYAAYKMVEFIVPFRDKHDEYRNDLPWLLYTTHNGWSYIQAMKLDKEESK